jgi:hypothetical protein
LWHSLNWQHVWWSIQRDGMAGQETIDIYKYTILYYHHLSSTKHPVPKAIVFPAFARWRSSIFIIFALWPQPHRCADPVWCGHRVPSMHSASLAQNCHNCCSKKLQHMAQLCWDKCSSKPSSTCLNCRTSSHWINSWTPETAPQDWTTWSEPHAIWCFMLHICFNPGPFNGIIWHFSSSMWPILLLVETTAVDFSSKSWQLCEKGRTLQAVAARSMEPQNAEANLDDSSMSFQNKSG